eukprot:454481-Amphidinium_carterae.2
MWLEISSFERLKNLRCLLDHVFEFGLLMQGIQAKTPNCAVKNVKSMSLSECVELFLRPVLPTSDGRSSSRSCLFRAPNVKATFTPIPVALQEPKQHNVTADTVNTPSIRQDKLNTPKATTTLGASCTK